MCCGSILVPQTSRVHDTKVPACGMQLLKIFLLAPLKNHGYFLQIFRFVMESIHSNNFLNKSADLSSVCSGSTLVPQTSRVHETKVPACGMRLMKIFCWRHSRTNQQIMVEPNNWAHHHYQQHKKAPPHLNPDQAPWGCSDPGGHPDEIFLLLLFKDEPTDYGGAQ